MLKKILISIFVLLLIAVLAVCSSTALQQALFGTGGEDNVPEQPSAEQTTPDAVEIIDGTSTNETSTQPQAEQTAPDTGEIIDGTSTNQTTAQPPTVQTTSDKTAEPNPVEHPERIVLSGDVKSRFHSTSGITNYYILEANTEDGKTIEFIDRAVTLNYKQSTKRADSQIAELNRLADSNPDVNFYVYLGTRLQETDDSEMCFPDVEGSADVLKYFEDNLSDNISVRHFKQDSVEDRLNTYYITDHHWTAVGVLQAYRDIIDQFKSKIPDMSDAREPVEYYVVEGVKFNGVHSRELSKYDIYDDFAFYDFNLPSHDQIGGTSLKTMMRKFKRNDFKANSSLYEQFYQWAEKYDYTDNDTGRNLLLIGDSFMYCQAELLASHFDETYTLHVDVKKEFDYNEYIKKKGITDVMVLCYDLRLIYAHIGDIHLERMLTD
jgi:hypothetical protein